MAKRSFVYRNIFIYRLIMNLLYLGRYKRRFDPVVDEVRQLPKGSRVLELCFGDIYLAEFCRKAGYKWTGLDINPNFVRTAQRMGFEAREADLKTEYDLPRVEVCIMMGSLYHFYPDTANIIAKMLKAASLVLISEPVSNFSSNTGIIGFIAKRTANAGKGHELFRYNKHSFLAMLDQHSAQMQYQCTTVREHGKDLIVKLMKNERY